MQSSGQSSAQVSKSDKSCKIIFITALLFFLAGLLHYVLSPLAIAGDTAMYLQCGQLLWQGQLPYVDFLDLNPPLIMYISMIPALMSKLGGINLALAGALFTSFLALFAFMLTAGCAKFVFRRMTEEQKYQPALLATALFTPVVLNGLAMFDFGQREHLYSLFLLPFFLLRYGRYLQYCSEPPNQSEIDSKKTQSSERILAVLVGLSFGLMLSFKPHFLLAPALLELYWLARYKKPHMLLSPELLVAPLPLVLYLGSFFIMPAAIKSIYFGEIAPLLVKGYACFNIVKDVVVNMVWRFSIAAYFVSLLLLLAIPKQLALRAPLAIMLSAALALIELQQKFWNYHALPLYLWEAFILLLAANVLCRALPGKTKKALAYGALSICFLALQGGCFLFHDLVEKNWLRPWDDYLAQNAQAGDSALLLDTSDTPWFKSALRFDLKPGSRYLWLYAVPMLQYQIDNGKAQERDKAKAALEALFANLAQEIDNRKPKYVLIKRKEAFGMNPDLDFYRFLLERGLAAPLSQYDTVKDYGDNLLLVRKIENKKQG
jgi:hypothetical protein